MELSWKSHGILFYTFRGNPAKGVGIAYWFHTGIAELHTYSVGCVSLPGMGEYISEKKYKKKLIKNPVELMWSGCGGFTGTFREAEICPGLFCFPVTPINQFLIILGRCTLYTPVCLQDEPTCLRIEPV